VNSLFVVHFLVMLAVSLFCWTKMTTNDLGLCVMAFTAAYMQASTNYTKINVNTKQWWSVEWVNESEFIQSQRNVVWNGRISPSRWTCRWT